MIEIRGAVKALSQQGISLSIINDRIKSFAYGRLDRSNKPDQISLTQGINQDNHTTKAHRSAVSLGQRAYQMLVLFRLLPWILRGMGNLPPSFLSATRLVSLLLSPSFNRARDLNLITHLAETYLQVRF